MFLINLLRSLYCLRHCIPLMMTIVILDFADGVFISWPAVPDEQTNVKQGSTFNLLWRYKMNENETFLSSEIEKNVKEKRRMASRHKGENKYYKYDKNDSSFSVFGENNLTLTVHSAKIGHEVTYCCEVVWRSAAGKHFDKKCAKVSVYAVPKITNKLSRLSCKQGESIRLQCNATGIPTPHVQWMHNETHELIDRSSDILLNITGKRSEGRYCCNADNGFGRETACTAVNVTEYEPVNTMLLVKQTTVDQVNIQCKADASPSANHFIINVSNIEYNSSNGQVIITVKASGKDKIDVSCIPCNKYGQGPSKKIDIPLHAPGFISPLRTEYNMTDSGIIMKCDITGAPTPLITWTSKDTGDTVSTGRYYKVPYVKCATKNLTFFCHARNAMGHLSSPGIHVKVNTRNCSTNKGLEETTTNATKTMNFLVAGVVSVVAVTIAVAVVVVVYRSVAFRKKEKKNSVINKAAGSDANRGMCMDDGVPECESLQPSAGSTAILLLANADTEYMDDSPYHEPIDAVEPGRQGSQSLERSNTTLTDEGYATVEECRPCIRRVWPRPRNNCMPITVKNNPHPGEDDPMYESLVLREINKTPDAT